jgi:hypothetical protein
MTLTAAHTAILEAPFRANEHRFDASNNLYLDKEAIRRRLSLVDPHWMQSEPHLASETADLVSLSATITLGGATRSALGVAIVNRWKSIDDKQPDGSTKKKRIEIDGYDLARAKRLAYKYADADLLPRIAMQFGVGAYLKEPAVKAIKTEKQLAEFLAKLPPPPDAHWSLNGGRQRIGDFMKLVHLEWNAVNALVEPGKTLAGLSDTALSEVQFMARLAELAFKPAAPKTAAPEAAIESH